MLQAIGIGLLLVIGLVHNFWVVVALVVLWALSGSAVRPIRQAYLNAMIPSQQRATILSFDSLMTSSGGIVAQPVLGKSADIWGYQFSYLISGIASAVALPFLFRARTLADPADTEAAPTETPASD